MNILGVRVGHDSSAALLIKGEIIADVSEERFTRIKNDSSFPINSISYALEQGNISSEDLDILAIPSKSIISEFNKWFDHEDIKKLVIKGSSKLSKLSLFLRNFKRKRKNVALPIYLKKFKLSDKCKILLFDHHLCHAASAFYTSGLPKEEKSLIFTLDGIGDGVSACVWENKDGSILKIKSYDSKGSLGWFYGNVTESIGWKQSSDEWKLMGLAPYGNHNKVDLSKFCPQYQKGALKKGYKYNFFSRWNDHGCNHYHSEDANLIKKFTQGYKVEDIAASAQYEAEKNALNFIKPLIKKYGVESASFAGGFFLNVKLNQKLWEQCLLKKQWIFPNQGDSGLSLGATFAALNKVQKDLQPIALNNYSYGPSYSNSEIKEILDSRLLQYEFFENIEEVTAKYLSHNYAVAWFHGRMESGPRALGNRSILMSPLEKRNKDIVNKKIKYREAFRPFCPSILNEFTDKFFINFRDEHFMTTSFQTTTYAQKTIPAVVHEDNTARPQFVRENTNKRYYKLIKEFYKITNVPVLLNTSLNIKGEPMICNPREALKCFYDTGLDVLVLENFILVKKNVKNLFKN